MGDSLPRTPMNRHAKFYAASFILAGEICNCTNTHTNKQELIYPHFAYRHVWIISIICKLLAFHIFISLH